VSFLSYYYFVNLTTVYCVGHLHLRHTRRYTSEIKWPISYMLSLSHLVPVHVVLAHEIVLSHNWRLSSTGKNTSPTFRSKPKSRITRILRVGEYVKGEISILDRWWGLPGRFGPRRGERKERSRENKGLYCFFILLFMTGAHLFLTFTFRNTKRFEA
jgi:hypothetical protein